MSTMPGGLVGRDHELDIVSERVLTRRLVTIVGPGGVGKTALARASAMRLDDAFPAGVRHVDLTRVTDATEVAGAVASQLGFDSFDSFIAMPFDQPVLIVVDNCEHVIDGAAEVVERVLGACGQAAVLTTSRSRLELPHESVVVLAPLALPAPGEDPRDCPAVRLFLLRCRDAGVDVAELPLESVVTLCNRLDGLPLAIEIAAARTRNIGVAEIANRVGESVDVLDRRRFRGDPRHRGLTSAIDWSCDMLEPSAGRLLEQLGVFSGPFSGSAAAAVAGEPDGWKFDLDSLVHGSLVVADTSGVETRYRLLDTMRRYALDRLAARDGVAEAYDRYVDVVADRTVELLFELFGGWRADQVRALVDTYGDIAAALRWCIDHDDTPHRAHRLCAPLAVIVTHGHVEESTALMRQLVSRFPDQHTAGGAQAHAVLATCESYGNPRAAIDIGERTLRAFTGRDTSTVALHRALGRARNALGDHAGAIDNLRAGARLGYEVGVPGLAQQLDVSAAVVAADLGLVSEALAETRSIAAAARASGSGVAAAWASAAYSWIELRVDPQAALASANAALAYAREIDFAFCVAVNLRTKAFAHLLLGDRPAAVATVTELVDDLLARSVLSNLRLLVDVAAPVAQVCGHPAWSRLAATARCLPITTPASSQFEVVPLPPVAAAPIPLNQLVAQVRATLDELAAGSVAAPDIAAGASPATARLETIGHVCEIEFEGRVVAMRASKGIAYIARLVAAAGQEIHCTDLAGAAVAQPSTESTIDDQARREDEERIRELQHELDEAERDNDYGRTYRLQAEFDAVIDHLAAGLARGLGSREGVDTTERARSAVTHRVRSTIRQVTRLHPTLGRHLEHSISTGTYCRYNPAYRIEWKVS